MTTVGSYVLPDIPSGQNPFLFLLDAIQTQVIGPPPTKALQKVYIALFVITFCNIVLFALRLLLAWKDGKQKKTEPFAIWRTVHDSGKPARVFVFSSIVALAGISASIAILGVAINYYIILVGAVQRRASLFWTGLPLLFFFLTGAVTIVCTMQAFILAKTRQNQDFWLKLHIFNWVCIGLALVVVVSAVPVILNTSLSWTRVWKAWRVVQSDLQALAPQWPARTVDSSFLATFTPDYETLQHARERYMKRNRQFWYLCIAFASALSLVPSCLIPFVLLLRKSIKARKELLSNDITVPSDPNHVGIDMNTPYSSTVGQRDSYFGPDAKESPSLPSSPVTPTIPVTPSTLRALLSTPRLPGSPKVATPLPDEHTLAIQRAEKELITIASGVFVVSSMGVAVVAWNMIVSSRRKPLTPSIIDMKACLMPLVAAGSLFLVACYVLWLRYDWAKQVAKAQERTRLGSNETAVNDPQTVQVRMM